MPAEQSMTWAVKCAAIEAAKATIMTIRKAHNLVNKARPVHAVPKIRWPSTKTTYIRPESVRQIFQYLFL